MCTINRTVKLFLKKYLTFMSSGDKISISKKEKRKMTLTIEKVILIWNIIVFFIYGIDKWRAGNSKKRTSEFTLILSAILLAAPGAMFGMVIFNHKTSKPLFRYGVPVLFMATPTLYELFLKYAFPYIVKVINTL